MKNKEHLIWFIKTDGLESWALSAKMKQINDWVERENPFGSRYNVLIVPSDENKFSLLTSEEDFRENFQGDPEAWLDKVRDRLRDCLTVHLPVKTSE